MSSRRNGADEVRFIVGQEAIGFKHHWNDRIIWNGWWDVLNCGFIVRPLESDAMKLPAPGLRLSATAGDNHFPHFSF